MDKLIGDELVGLLTCPFCDGEVSHTGGSITGDSMGGIWIPLHCKSCKTSFWTTKKIFNTRLNKKREDNENLQTSS